MSKVLRHLGTIQPVQPYNFVLLLDLLGKFAHPTVDVVRDDAYWRVLHSPGGPVLLKVTATERSPESALTVHLVTGGNQMDDKALLDEVAHILGARTDVKPFFAFARTQSELWEVVAPLEGVRWLRAASVFEALMTTIIEQQIAWVAAQRAQRWLVEWGGHCAAYNGQAHYAFPTPKQIAAAEIEDLTPLKITFRRMGVMIAVARQIVSGDLQLENLRGLSSEAGYKRLVALKGIGHWTAAWTLQRAQGPHNYVGHNDVALQAAVNHYFYGGAGRIPGEQVLRTFERYGDFAGLAAHYTILRWVLDRY